MLHSATFGRWVEGLIQAWIKFTGQSVAVAEVPWLAGPVGTAKIGAGFYDEYAKGANLVVRSNERHAGLLSDFDLLCGPTFEPAKVEPDIHQFYEETANYTLDVWSQWYGLFHPFAKILITLVSRHIEQLNLPLAPLETSQGMKSEILRLIDPNSGTNPYTGWLRTFSATGRIVYAGFYTISTPPKASGPCVKVVFPLPHGSSTVLLQPENQADGSLVLRSAAREFGSPGYYRIHQVTTTHLRVKCLPFRECIHVYLDPDGILRTDHTFTIWNIKLLTLHYKISRRTF